MSNATGTAEEAVAGINLRVAALLKAQRRDYDWLSTATGVHNIKRQLESEHVPWLTVVRAASALGVGISELMPVEDPVDVPYLARYLKKSEYTIRRYAATKEIPAFKSGREWRFYLSEVRASLTDRATA